MSKCAGESFGASAIAKQTKPVHSTAMIARELNDKNADMDDHAVRPPGYKSWRRLQVRSLRQGSEGLGFSRGGAVMESGA